MRRRDFLKVSGSWPIGAQLGLLGSHAAAQGQPEGQLTIAFDASTAPTFLDPAETPGIGTPFVFLYALGQAPFQLRQDRAPHSRGRPSSCAL